MQQVWRNIEFNSIEKIRYKIQCDLQILQDFAGSLVKNVLLTTIYVKAANFTCTLQGSLSNCQGSQHGALYGPSKFRFRYRLGACKSQSPSEQYSQGALLNAIGIDIIARPALLLVE